MEETTPPVTPASETPRFSRKTIIIGIGVLVLGVALLLAFVGLKNGEFNILPVSEEQTFSYVTRTGYGSEALMLSQDAFGKRDVGAPGTVVEYKEAEDVAVAILRSDDALPRPTTEVYVLGDTPRALTDDGYAKAGLAVSHDGTKVAFARINEDRSYQQFSSLLSDWMIVVVDVATGEQEEVGTGFGAQFADPANAGVLLYATEEGVQAVDVVSGAVAVNEFVEVASAHYTPSVSPDGSHTLVYNPETQRYAVFEITSLFPSLTLTPVSQISDALVHAVMQNDTVYGIAKGEGDALELRAYAVGDLSTGRVVRSLPAGNQIYQLIPNR